MNEDKVLVSLGYLENIYRACSSDLHSYGVHPQESSIAKNDMDKYPNHTDTLKMIAEVAQIFVISGIDTLLGIENVLKTSRIIMPFLACRTILEYTAIHSWITDSSVSTNERLKRLFSIRYNYLVEKVKLYRSVSENIVENRLISENIVESIIEQKDILISRASEFGIEVLKNKNQEIIGLGAKYPSMTSLIKEKLKQDVPYRIFSAIIHGQYGDLADSVFQEKIINDEIVREPFISDNTKIECCRHYLLSLKKIMRNHYIYMGYNFDRIDIEFNIALEYMQ